MKTYIILIVICLFFIGCEKPCKSKLMISDSRGIRSRCASQEEANEIRNNPELNKYVYER